MTKTSKSQQVRRQLNHPVIDSDGHMLEFQPPLEDYVKAIGGTDLELRFSDPFRRMSRQEETTRRDARRVRPVWWTVPTKNSLDRATAALPKLLYQRLDEIGIDFTVLFSSMYGAEVFRPGSEQSSVSDPELRRIRLRAINAFRTDLCREYADRMTPAAEISMETPGEAMDDLDYAAKTLGMKVISVNTVRRPIPAVHRKHPDLFPLVSWVETFGLDSEYVYDPFWAKCVDLGVPVMGHFGGMGFGCRNSPTNYMYNHIGHLADGGEAVCKSLFFSGVTKRFPTLNFAFLEGGVAWACRTYCDLMDRWEKRGRYGIQNYNPANLDRELFLDLHRKHGDKQVGKRLDQVLQVGGGIHPELVEDPVMLNDFSACGVDRPEEIRDLFVPNFFFGCESDDPMNSMAFNTRLLPFGVHLNAVLSSDISHWDVQDMTGVLEEAYDLVERGLMTQDDFRDFTFTNPAKLFTGMNPNFFEGTVIESNVHAMLNNG